MWVGLDGFFQPNPPSHVDWVGSMGLKFFFNYYYCAGQKVVTKKLTGFDFILLLTQLIFRDGMHSQP